MDETSLSDPVGLSPKNIYGLRKEVRGNINFSFNDEVIYPCESVLVFHNFNTKKQRFLRLPVNTVPTVIAMNVTRKLIAVVEITTSDDKQNSTNISIYDTSNLKKRRNFKLPSGHENKEIIKMVFSNDSRSLLVLTKKPSETLFVMMFNKAGTILDHVVGVASSRITATCIAGNPQDTGLIAVCGDGILKLFSKSETGFTLSGSIRAHFSVKSMAWLSMDILLLGCAANKLAIVENGEVKSQHIATEIEMLDLSQEQEEEIEDEIPFIGRPTVPLIETNDSVICVRSLSRCIAYVVDDKVYFFEKISKYEYQRTAIITLQKQIYTDDVFAIKNMAINAQQDTVIVTAEHSQIYVCYLQNEESIKMKFEPLGEFIHIDEIIDISVCAWRTIIMTASKDQTIRVWNYETETLELVKRYQVDITVTELNITGQFAAIGFADQLRVMTILLDDLNLMKAYNFPRCAQVKYSCFGHLMAAAYESLISITAVYNMDIIKTLKGHNGNVLSLAWSRDDKYLISGGAEGAIYQWDVDKGERVQEIVQKGTEYRALCCTCDPMVVIAVTGSGLMREIINSEITRDLSTPNKDPFLSLALARSDQVMFATTNATHLYNITVPFDAGGGTFTNYRFFDSPVTKVVFSYDGTLLITGSKNGTLGIWILTNIDGKVAPLDRDLLNCKEVVIPREALQEKIDLIANLELRIIQQAAEFQYQESQNEIFDSQQLADVHKGYCLAIEALKIRNNELEQRHTEDLNDLTFRMNDLKNEYGRQILNLSNQFSERMLKEYHTYMSVSHNSKLIIEEYEAKLRTSAGQLQDTVEALEVDFKTKLEQKEELIRDLMQELQDNKYEFNDYCHQVAMENQKNVKDTMIKYENILKAELDEEIMWRGKAAVMNQKVTNIKKEAERLLEEINLLNEEDVKSELIISKLMLEKDNLSKNVSDCEFAISLKEKRIQEILHKNQELEKHKQVLNHKITELKMQIEPRERQINEKRDQITSVENDLDALNRENLDYEAQLARLTEQYRKTVVELEDQRKQSTTCRELFYRICTDVYNVAGNIANQKQLDKGIREMVRKYASDDQLKKKIFLESLVKAEFNRQRGNIQSQIDEYKRKIRRKEKATGSGDLLNENVTLLKEIEVVKTEGSKCLKDINFVMNALKIPDLKSPQTQQRLSHTLKEIEMYRMVYEEEIDDLESQLHHLNSSIDGLRRESKDLDREALITQLHQ